MVKETIIHWIPTLPMVPVVFRLAGSTTGSDLTRAPAMWDMCCIFWPALPMSSE